jgi:hypothetical protein
MYLISIAWTLAFGAGTLLCVLALFAISFCVRSHLIAPRTIARPKVTMAMGSSGLWSKCGLAFICSSWRWSYDAMLNGMQGTGTRDEGHSGPLLSMNLDALVFLRFHEMCFKYTCFLMTLSLLVILPVNLTANCYGKDNTNEACADLTDYDRTTSANLPQRELAFWGSGIQVRGFVVAVFTWIVVAVLCYFLWGQWVYNLRLRRRYYLEADHYTKATDFVQQVSSMGDDDETMARKTASYKQPWIADPEQLETVPAIELYSALVGNLPTKPTEIIGLDSAGAQQVPPQADAADAGSIATQSTARKKNEEIFAIMKSIPTIEWQLAVTSATFDRAIPEKEDCFTSSVAAITILPDSSCLALSWRRWYAAINAQRRLKFVRQLLTDRGALGDIDEISAGLNDLEARNSNLIDPFSVIPFHGSVQRAMYSRELAQSSSMCCPLGCNENSVRNMPTEELIEYESELLEEVLLTSQSLREAQERAITKANVETNKKGSPRTGQKMAKESKKAEQAMALEIQLTELYGRKEQRNSTGSANSLGSSGLKGIAGSVQGPVNMKAMASSPSPVDQVRYGEEGEFKEETGSLDGEGADDAVDVATRGSVIYHTGVTTPISIELSSPETPASSRPKIYILPSPRSLARRTMRSPLVSPAPSVLSPRPFTSARLRAASENYAEPPLLDSELSPAPRKKRAHTLDTVSPIDDVRDADARDDCTVFTLNADGIMIARKKREQEHPSILPSVSLSSSSSSIRADEIPEGHWSLSSSCGKMGRMVRRGASLVGGFFRSAAAALVEAGSLIISPRRWSTLCSRAAKTKDEFMFKGGSYAVVTFTSRQAAAMARNCNVDGRGTASWFTSRELPVTPLSEAAPCDIKTCRNCCRPVTLSLNPTQKRIRKYIGIILLVVIYCSYTIPISIIAELTKSNTDTLITVLFPVLGERTEAIVTGFVPAVLQTLFFSVAPYLFKTIANFSSGATSMNDAESSTLKYYWYFMLTTAFTGTFLATLFTNLFRLGSTGDFFYGTSFTEVVQQIATDLPTVSSAVWLNWILVRSLIVLPLQYLYQVNAQVFTCLRWRCCARCSQGGSNGGPLPFRVYVDSSVVLLCCITFSAVSPLVIPCALLYFGVCIPLWRRQLLLVHRPIFDAGGQRWPELFTFVMSAIYLSVVLISVILFLKNLWTPSVLCFVTIFPVIDFQRSCLARFQRAYSDVGLMQAGLINESNKTGGVLANMEKGFGSAAEERDYVEEKERLRLWLVDAHLAAFIPICMSDNRELIETLTVAPAETTFPEYRYSAAWGGGSGGAADTSEAASEADDEGRGMMPEISQMAERNEGKRGRNTESSRMRDLAKIQTRRSSLMEKFDRSFAAASVDVTERRKKKKNDFGVGESVGGKGEGEGGDCCCAETESLKGK